jgi:DNA-binding response OmpR family regulator
MVVEEILIVNDGSLLLKMLAGLLESKGYPLILTDSSEEALALLSSRNIILALIKLNGRQTDRLALLHMVKELDAETKLIIMGDQTRLPVEAYEAEADDYLLLPCRPAEIWRRLNSYLKPPASQPVVTPEEGLRPPVIQGVLHNQSFMFPHVQGMKPLDRRMDDGFNREGKDTSQKAFQKTRTGASRLDLQ